MNTIPEKNSKRKAKGIHPNHRPTNKDAEPRERNRGAEAAKSKRPKAIKLQFERIPAELCQREQWVVWRYVRKGDKWTKVPFNAETDDYASSTDPQTWTTFKRAKAAFLRGNYDGIGYAFSGDDPFTGVDFDHCFDDVDGKKVIKPDAERWVENFDSYTERSVGGNGLHVIIEAEPSDSFNNHPEGVELYDRARYFTFTGDSYHDEPKPIAKRQDVAEVFINKYSPKKRRTSEEQIREYLEGEERIKQMAREAQEWCAEQKRLLREEWGGLSPFEAYQMSGDVTSLLNEIGAEYVGSKDVGELWRHPDSNNPYSLVIFHDTGVIYLLTHRWEPMLKQGKPYSKGDFYAAVKHNGDRKAAYRALLEEGYGERPKSNATKNAQAEHVITPRTDFSHEGVLKDILSNLPTDVDFHAEAGLPSGQSVPQKHYCVITVRKVREVANSLNCGLCKRDAFTYQYNGQYWKPVEKDELSHFLGEAAGKLGVESITAQYCKFRDLLVDQFQSDAYLPPPTPRDGVTLINLANGTFEISADKRELREFRREDFMAYQLPFAYDPNAQAPMWERFLNEVLPDKDLQDIIAEYMGYCFTHGLKLEKVLLMYGEGANGKSVIFDVMNALFGAENISNYGLSELTTGSEQVYNRAKIADKLLNFSSELGGRYTSDTFKKMVSCEPITGRLPYGQPFTLTKYAKMTFNTNELPIVTEHKHAFFRRLLIVPFDVIVPDEKQDRDLASKIIAAELPGVFNWVLAGLERLLERRKFTESKASVEAVDRYRRDSDSVAMFLQDEWWESDEDSKTSLTELYKSYQSYCKDNGHAFLGKQKFGRRLESLKIARTEVRKQPYFMLRRVTNADAEAEQPPFNADESRRHLRVVKS